MVSDLPRGKQRWKGREGRVKVAPCACSHCPHEKAKYVAVAGHLRRFYRHEKIGLSSVSLFLCVVHGVTSSWGWKIMSLTSEAQEKNRLLASESHVLNPTSALLRCVASKLQYTPQLENYIE